MKDMLSYHASESQRSLYNFNQSTGFDEMRNAHPVTTDHYTLYFSLPKNNINNGCETS